MQLTGSFLGSAVHAEHNNVHHNFADPRVEISSLHAARGQHIRGEQSAERLVATFVDSLYKNQNLTQEKRLFFKWVNC
jgi:hypothetical protein